MRDSGQNIEPQWFTGKILQDKGLRTKFKVLPELAAEDLVEKPWRIR
jgi:hypothetical protein